MNQEVQEQITHLQMIEQHMQQFLMQKQTIQIQLVETENALEEVGKTKEIPYKIIGSIMVCTPKEELQKDLESKKEMLAIRLKNVEKQETQLKEKMETLHTDLIKKIEK